MLDIFLGKERKRTLFLGTWRPIIDSSKVSMPSNLSPLEKSDALFFIEEWNTQHSQANEQQKIGLSVLASQLEIYRYAKGMLVDSKETVRLMGIQLLGNLRDETLWKLLYAIANQNNQNTSIMALEAMFKINSRRAFDELMLTLIKHTNWPLEEVINTLKNLDTVDVCYFIQQAINDTIIDEKLGQTYLNELNCKS